MLHGIDIKVIYNQFTVSVKACICFQEQFQYNGFLGNPQNPSGPMIKGMYVLKVNPWNVLLPLHAWWFLWEKQYLSLFTAVHLTFSKKNSTQWRKQKVK